MTRRRMTRGSRTAHTVLSGLGAGSVLTVAGLVSGPALLPADDDTAHADPAERLAATAPLAGAPTTGSAAETALPAAAEPDMSGAFDAARTAALATAPAPAAPATPAPAPRAAPEPDDAEPAPTLTGPESEVVALTNAERVDAGCGALTVDPRIADAAQGHSDDMAARDYFAHDSQDGRSFDQRIAAAGYPQPGAENIAQGQDDARTVVRDWMESPGHRKNILDCSLRTIGVGLSGDGQYWTQDFGR